MNCAEFQQVLPGTEKGGRSAEQELHLQSCSVCSDLVSDLDFIVREARTLQASEEPSPQVWQSIQAEIAELRSELDLIAREARALQASEEPSPAVWKSIQAEIGDWQTEMASIAAQARELQASHEPSPRVWNSLEIALREEGLIRQPQRETVPMSSRRWRLGWLVPVATAALVAFGVLLYRPTIVNQGEVAQSASPRVFHTNNQVSVKDDQELLNAVGTRSPAMRVAYENDLRDVNAYIRDAEQSAAADPNDEEVQQYLMDAYQQKNMVYQMALDRSLP